MAFLFGGIGHKEQTFNATVASTMSSLMAVATSSLIIPAALYATLERSDSPPHFEQILRLSRGTSIVLLGLYILFLWFQLSTHKYIFDSVTEPAPGPAAATNGSTTEENGSPAISNDADTAAATTTRSKEPKEPEPKLGMVASIALLLLVTVLVSICAEYLVGSIEGIVESSGISKTFIGLILIPIVGNAAEHATAVVAAVRNKVIDIPTNIRALY
jgi:Ca2+:H+ antiporter